MAYTLKSTGIATQLTYCVALDDDGTTIREFVSPTVDANKTIDAGVTVATGTWASTPRNYFVSSGSGFSPVTVKFTSGFRPVTTPSAGNGVSNFCAFEEVTDGQPGPGSAVGNMMSGVSATFTCRFNANANGTYATSGDLIPSAQVYPTTGGTAFSIGSRYEANAVSSFGYGVRDAAYSQEANQVAPNFGGPNSIESINGNTGGGVLGAKCYINCAFDGLLTDQDFADLHNDWFGTLFEGGAPAVTVDDTGTLADGGTGAEIRAGGETLISTVTNDTFDPTLGQDNAITTAWLQGYTSDGVEAGGWNAQVRDQLTFAAVTRDSATQATLLLPAFPAFTISALETITHTVPASALVTSPDPVVATPTFQITPSLVAATIVVPELRNNTGTLLTGLTGLVADCADPSTGAVVVRVTGLVSDVSTADVVISDALLTATQDYIVTLQDSIGTTYAVRRLTAT